MNQLKEFFIDKSANKLSMTRLLTFGLFVISAYTIAYQVTADQVDLGLIGLLLGYVFAGKHVAKHLENQKSA